MTDLTPLDRLSRQIRVLTLLDSCDLAGLAPVPVDRLHLLAYLTNALAPVWDMEPMDGSLLKKRAGPYYPDLQADVDRLVGKGLVRVVEIGHVQDEDRRWRVTGSFALNRTLAAAVLDAASVVGHPDVVSPFIRELTFAVSALEISLTDALADADATYSDPMVSIGNVIDFGQWRNVNYVNYTANAADHFRAYLPEHLATPAELTHMYFRLASARSVGE